MDNALNIFIGGMILPQYEAEIRGKSKSGVQNAANLFQQGFVDGLRSNLDNLTVLNLPFIGSWPLNYTSPLAPAGFDTTEYNSEGKEIAIHNRNFLNLTYFKLFTREWVCYRALRRIIKEKGQGRPVNIFVYSVHLPFLKGAIRVKRGNPSVRIYDIITDLPEYKTDDATGVKGWLLNYDTHVDQSVYDSMDGFILLTEAMAERVVRQGQPYTVIEGLYQNRGNKEAASAEGGATSGDPITGGLHTICYTGTLDRRYNIMTLVEAFMQVPNPDLRLVICGRGNSADDIMEAARRDPRIDYRGELPYGKVAEIQRRAALLVNPRTAEGEFTKYSFPSKTMEYMASGVPVLMYRLPGVPAEYYEHCYSLDQPGVEPLRDKIAEIFSLPAAERAAERAALGARARAFVLTRKTPRRQLQALRDLLAAEPRR